ncbi:MAG: ABC transporter ATP-binding protein [Bdellovibrionota bacterium]
MGRPVLQIENLKKTYRKGWGSKPVPALKGVSFEIKPGTITGFLGANGAGKTSTIKCIFELSFPDSGEISYFGEKGLSSSAKKRIGFLPERPYFYEHLTGREFLRFYGQLSTSLKRSDLEARIEKLLVRVGLSHAASRPLRGYSKGMLQRIGIAQALVHEPEFIILDEPMTGLDPDGRLEVREIILETAARGTAVFFSSHLLPDAEQLCSHLVILKKGELVYRGETKELLGKVERGFRVVWSEAGVQQTRDAVTSAELQALIDSVRAKRGDVLEVKPLRLTLEEAFAKIAFDPKAERI